MEKRVFISYSHKDERHRKDLEDHLVMLQRQGVISIWHDRKITAGEEWKGEIDQNLKSADIVLFLISPSFLASDYCIDIEMKEALKRKESGTVEIILVIVRPCAWHDGNFSKYQAVPKDAKPVTTWENVDTAWLDAAKSIKESIEKFNPQRTSVDIEKSCSPSPSELTKRWLEDTEIDLSHRRVSTVKLSDIYVDPDMELESYGQDETLTIKSTKTLVNDLGRYVLSGEEQQGRLNHPGFLGGSIS